MAGKKPTKEAKKAAAKKPKPKNKPKTDKQKKKIIADWVELGSYSAVAKKHHISANTVKKYVQADPEFAKACEQEKNACARDVLSHMKEKSAIVCTILDNALQVLASPEKMADATPNQITTAMGTLIDKWAMLEDVGGATEIVVTMDETLKEWSN